MESNHSGLIVAALVAVVAVTGIALVNTGGSTGAPVWGDQFNYLAFQKAMPGCSSGIIDQLHEGCVKGQKACVKQDNGSYALYVCGPMFDTPWHFLGQYYSDSCCRNALN